MCIGPLLACIPQLTCCAATSAWNCIPSSSRLNYALLFLLNALIQNLLLLESTADLLAKLNMAYFNLKCGEDLHCVGVLAVYRFSFALASFHFLLAIILSYKFNLAKVIQSGFWIIKFPVYCLFVFIAFLIPNGFFQFIATWIYLPGAFIFVMIQVLLLISFAYDVAESLLESWEQTDDKKWLILLLSLTFGSLIATMIITVLLYVWYGSPECQLNQFFISFNLVLCFIVVIASCNHLVQEANPKSGMAQASMVAVYATCLFF